MFGYSLVYAHLLNIRENDPLLLTLTIFPPKSLDRSTNVGCCFVILSYSEVLIGKERSPTDGDYGVLILLPSDGADTI